MKDNIRYAISLVPPNYSIFKKMFLKLFGRKMVGDCDGYRIEGYLYKGCLFITRENVIPWSAAQPLSGPKERR